MWQQIAWFELKGNRKRNETYLNIIYLLTMTQYNNPYFKETNNETNNKLTRA